MHYLHCSKTPDIPQPPPIDTNAIEMIVRRIMAEESSKPIVDGQISPIPAQKYVNSELIDFNDGIDLLGEDSIAAIKNTIEEKMQIPERKVALLRQAFAAKAKR